jgi:hypothetical protein
MKAERYTELLKFFRSSSFDIDGLYRKLITVFLKILPPKTIDGKVILVGDHIKISKEGRRMPAIKKLHQESRDAGKEAFIEGHLFGFISMIIPGFNRSIPVMAGIQESKSKTGGESLVEQMVRQAGKAAEMMGKPAVLLLDAYFFSKTTLSTAAQYVGKNGQALLDVIVRAKQIAVAYLEPEEGSGKRRGRKRIYGKKIILVLFEAQRAALVFQIRLIDRIRKCKHKRMVHLMLFRPINGLIEQAQEQRIQRVAVFGGFPAVMGAGFLGGAAGKKNRRRQYCQHCQH